MKRTIVIVMVCLSVSATYRRCFCESAGREREALRHLNAANLYLSQNKLNDAVREYEQVLTTNPKHLMALVKLGETYAKLRRWEKAVEALQKASEFGPAKDRFQDLTDWQVIGPFENRDDKGFDKVFPPEREFDANKTYTGIEGEELHWERVTGKKVVDLLAITTATGPAVAYAVTFVESPDDRQVEMSLGSDDGVKVWVNDELVWSNHVHRPMKQGQDTFVASLRKGRNKILLKVDQGTAEWEVTARVVYEMGVGNRLKAAMNQLKKVKNTAFVGMSDVGLNQRSPRNFWVYQGGKCLLVGNIARGARLAPGIYDIKVGFPSGYVSRTYELKAGQELILPTGLLKFDRIMPKGALSATPQSLFYGTDYLATCYAGDVVRLYPGTYTIVTEEKFSLVKEWRVLGPFDNAGDRGFAKVYPPELDLIAPDGEAKDFDFNKTYTGLNGQELRWRRVKGQSLIDLYGLMPRKDAVAYAVGYLEMDDDNEKCQIRAGSDDGMKIWINDKLAWVNHVHRPLTPEVFAFPFRKGKNKIMVKVDQGYGEWEFSFMVRSLKGREVEVTADSGDLSVQPLTATDERRFGSLAELMRAVSSSCQSLGRLSRTASAASDFDAIVQKADELSDFAEITKRRFCPDATFAGIVEELGESLQNVRKAGQSKNAKGVRIGFSLVNRACQGCHKIYRKKK